MPSRSCRNQQRGEKALEAQRVEPWTQMLRENALLKHVRELEKENSWLRGELARINARRLYRLSHHLAVFLTRLLGPRPPAAADERRAAKGDTAAYWGRELWRHIAKEEKAFSWMHLPLMHAYVNRRITGAQGTHWIPWTKEKFAPAGFTRALSLGSGLGLLERHVASAGLCPRVDGVDLSEEAVQGATRFAREGGFTGLRYFVADLNQLALAPASYDAVLAQMSLHHVENLEALFEELDRALKPGGWLVVNEYFGPSRFQWTVEQIYLVNGLLSALPLRYRKTPAGAEKGLVLRPTVEEVVAQDPSEAIRSEEILPLLERHFTIREKADYGGTLLHLVLSDIAWNFDCDREEDQGLLGLMMLFEETLNEEGLLPSDFAVVVAQKRA